MGRTAALSLVHVEPPPEKRGLAFALYGNSCGRAYSSVPRWAAGITDNYTWRWIFFINLPVGIVTLFLVYRLIDDFTRVRGGNQD